MGKQVNDVSCDWILMKSDNENLDVILHPLRLILNKWVPNGYLNVAFPLGENKDVLDVKNVPVTPLLQVKKESFSKQRLTKHYYCIVTIPSLKNNLQTKSSIFSLGKMMFIARLVV